MKMTFPQPRKDYEIAQCDMRMQLELIRLQNNIAEREQAMGHWLRNHEEAIHELLTEYNRAKDRAEAAIKLLEQV